MAEMEEARLLRLPWAAGRGGQDCLFQCCRAGKQDKNSRSIWFKSTQKHFYQLHPPSYGTDRTGQAKYIHQRPFNAPAPAKPSHILSAGISKRPSVQPSLFYIWCKLNFLFWGCVWACARAFAFASNALNMLSFLKKWMLNRETLE